MSDFMTRASLAGAVDLSVLKKSDPAVQPAAKSGPAGSGIPTSIKVPDLITVGTEENFKSFLNLSGAVPVLIDFFASDLESSKTLSVKLERSVRAFSGKIFLLRIDTQASLNLAQAFGVKEAPSVVALLKGQPVPLFEGDQTEETIKTVLDRLLQVAQENGVNSTVEISTELPSLEDLPPKHKAAYDAIDSGNYELAVTTYQAALADDPSDSMAIAGLAQAKLLVRTKELDINAVIESAATDFESTIRKADAYVAVGNPAEGYQVVLTRFASADKEEREKLRKHLLELFAVSPADAPELASARRALAALLY